MNAKKCRIEQNRITTKETGINLSFIGYLTCPFKHFLPIQLHFDIDRSILILTALSCPMTPSPSAIGWPCIRGFPLPPVSCTPWASLPVGLILPNKNDGIGDGPWPLGTSFSVSFPPSESCARHPPLSICTRPTRGRKTCASTPRRILGVGPSDCGSSSFVCPNFRTSMMAVSPQS